MATVTTEYEGTIRVNHDPPGDAQYELLSHAHRRLLLGCLEEHDCPITLPDAAEEVTSAELGAPIVEIDPETIRRTYLDLYHTHVPKLVDGDAVRYHQDGDLIRLTETGADLVERMDRFR